MVKLRFTRRRFLAKASVSATMLGLIGATPLFSGRTAALATAMPATDAHLYPLVVEILNVTSGEMMFVVGTEEFVIFDPELAARLAHTVRDLDNKRMQRWVRSR